MDAVEHEMDLLAPAALRHEMKNESVKCVLGETPDQKSEYEKGKRIIEIYSGDEGFVEHVSNYRKIDYCRHRWVNMGEEFEDVALEHPRRFIAVRNIALHGVAPCFITVLDFLSEGLLRRLALVRSFGQFLKPNCSQENSPSRRRNEKRLSFYSFSAFAL